MNNQITAVVVDDDTILLDGRALVGMNALANALRSALESEPNFTLVIEPRSEGHYRGIGSVIYASQRVGVPVENLRWTMDDGALVSFDELKARNATPRI